MELVHMFNISKVDVIVQDALADGKILVVDKIMEIIVVEEQSVDVGATNGGNQMAILDTIIANTLMLETEELVD